MRARWCVLAVGGVLAVTGCTSSSFDATSVPTQAAAPYLCDGVPTAGLTALTGADALATDDTSTGTWGADFLCDALEGSSTRATVSSLDSTHRGGGTVDDQIHALAASQGAVEVEASATGAGYVLPNGDQPHAVWVCGDGRVTEVRLFSKLGDDAKADGLGRYLVSLLPWGCGDTTAPSARS